MDWLTQGDVALLRYSEPLVPAERRAWARALRVEAERGSGGLGPAGLAGGRGAVHRAGGCAEPRAGISAGVFAAAAAGTAWSAWSGPPGDSAIMINRVDVITVSVILAGLPWAVRRARGPVAGSRQARMIRTAGYAAILVLVLVKAAVERVADAPPNNLEASALAWTGEIVFLAVMAGYAAVILACTASRSPAVPRRLSPSARPSAPPSASWSTCWGRWASRFASPAGGRRTCTTRRWPWARCWPWVLPWPQDWRRPGGPAARCARLVPAPGKVPWPDCAPGRPPRW